MLLIAAIAGIYWLFAPDPGWQPPPLHQNDLRGVWTTSAAGYRNRFLQIADGIITFGWGEAGAGSYIIDDLAIEPADGTALVHLNYHDLGGIGYRFNFHYLPHGDGIIWLPHQQNIHWLRSNNEPVHIPEFR